MGMSDVQFIVQELRMREVSVIRLRGISVMIIHLFDLPSISAVARAISLNTRFAILQHFRLKAWSKMAHFSWGRMIYNP